jgi:hypothetical protein
VGNGPVGNGQGAGRIAGNQVSGNGAAGASASSALSSLNRGQVLMSVMGDDWQEVEAQLQSRREHFSRFQM